MSTNDPSGPYYGNGGPPAVRDVLAERHRQRTHEGWTEQHDDEHSDGELECAAATYTLYCVDGGEDGAWPWPWNDETFKPKDHRRNLVRAAALLIAAIEKIDRSTS